MEYYAIIIGIVPSRFDALVVVLFGHVGLEGDFAFPRFANVRTTLDGAREPLLAGGHIFDLLPKDWARQTLTPLFLPMFDQAMETFENLHISLLFVVYRQPYTL